MQKHLSLALFEEVHMLITNFDDITCGHVYRERNIDTDRLSKNRIALKHGVWNFFETRDAEVYEFYHRPFIDIQRREDNL